MTLATGKTAKLAKLSGFWDANALLLLK